MALHAPRCDFLRLTPLGQLARTLAQPLPKPPDHGITLTTDALVIFRLIGYRPLHGSGRCLHRRTLPCYNEAATVAGVVRDFRSYLPSADVYVYDNASTDDTAARARQAGACVRHEPLRGKGNVVRRMLSDIEADAYVLVDGDGTYDAASAPRLIAHLINNGLDMVNCARLPVAHGSFRPGHALGNRVLSGLITFVFGDRTRDVLSGYRVMSRRS